MHVVGHEYVGGYLAAFSNADFSQFMPVAQVIFSGEEVRLAIIAPLCDVPGTFFRSMRG